ncbi:Peroxidase [Heracleum sosnowskyi]|uniref:Peroxidase n=1 Tax=Heracleum sosnowskyi TaxID=360622 RepID=A0AAD8HE78_9APIA|nr:Peroxidase [Heracleum sosnowskyi]
MKNISVIIFVLVTIPFGIVMADLRVGFYNSTCPNAESIVRQVVQNRFKTDPSITAALLRMHFHDCFVRGCDASILIDSTKSKSSEKDAGPNLTVRGYELIDEAKKNVEAACPSTVSCADIITIATRDSVALAGGPNYIIPTGRRDGLVSSKSEVNLPGPSFSVPQALQSFSAKGLTLNDMVTLLGAHTVGVAHCNFFQARLSKPDPTMDSTLVATLSKVLLNKGVLNIDQQLALDKSSAPLVSNFARNGAAFQQSFADAMVKMGSIQVVVGTEGEIRQNCRVFNQLQQKNARAFGIF